MTKKWFSDIFISLICLSFLGLFAYYYEPKEPFKLEGVWTFYGIEGNQTVLEDGHYYYLEFDLGQQITYRTHEYTLKGTYQMQQKIIYVTFHDSDQTLFFELNRNKIIDRATSYEYVKMTFHM